MSQKYPSIERQNSVWTRTIDSARKNSPALIQGLIILVLAGALAIGVNLYPTHKRLAIAIIAIGIAIFIVFIRYFLIKPALERSVDRPVGIKAYFANLLDTWRMQHISTWVLIGAGVIASLILAAMLLIFSYKLTVILLLIGLFAAAMLIEPYCGVILLIMLALMHPEHRRPDLAIVRPALFLMGLTGFSWLIHPIRTRAKTALKTPQVLILIAFYSVMAISALQAEDKELAHIGLRNFLDRFLICFIIAGLIDKNSRLKISAWVLLLCGFYFAYEGVRTAPTAPERFGSMIFYRLDLSPLSRIIGQENYLAMFMAVLFPIAWMLMFSEKRQLLKVTLLAFCILYIITLMKTLSRGGTIAFVIMFVALLFTIPKKKLASVLALLLLLTLIIIAFAPTGYFERLKTTARYKEDPSATHRIDVWKEGFEMVKSRPLLGVGPNNYQIHADVPFQARRPHNAYMQVLGETGLIGFVVYLALIFFTFRDLWRSRKLLRKAKNTDSILAAIPLGLQLALIAFLVDSFWCGIADVEILYIIIGLSIAARLIAQKEIAKSSPEVFNK